MSTNILTTLDQRDDAEARLKALQTEIDEFYTTLEKKGFTLWQEMGKWGNARQSFWRKDNYTSAKYNTERAAVEAYLNNEIQWAKP